MDQIKQRALSSVKWTGLYSVFNAVSGPIYRIILAGILLPKDFASIAVVSLFIGIAHTIGNLGMGEAIIQKDEVKTEQISTLFFFNLVIFTLLAGVLYFLAAPIAAFYGFAGLTVLLQLTSLTIVLHGVTIVFRVCLQRDLLFKAFSLINIIRILTDTVGSVIFIKLGLGVKGYVLGTIVATVVYLLLLAGVALKRTALRIKLYFAAGELPELMGFGVFISLKQLLTYITQRADEIIIGKFLGAEILGLYFFGKELLQKSQVLITQALSQVMFPFFSKFKHNLAELAALYNRVSSYIGLIAFPLFLGIALAAPLFVPLLFGARWVDSIVIIRVFALMGIFTVLTANFATSLLYAIKQQRPVFYLEVISNLCYFGLLLGGIHYGISWVLLVYTLYICSKTTILQLFVSRNLNYRFREYLRNLQVPALGSLLMGLILFIMGRYLAFLPTAGLLVLEVLAGMAIYISAVYLLDRKLFQMVLRLIVRGSAKRKVMV